MGMIWLLLISVFAREIMTRDLPTNLPQPEGDAFPVSSYSGGRVSVGCLLPISKADLPKYLCRESDSGCTKLIRTERKDGWKTSGRFSIFNKEGFGVVEVIIRELTTLDSAIYRCGFEETTGSDTSFTGFNLTVTEAGQRSVQQNGQVGGDFSLTCSYPDEHRDSGKGFCWDEREEDKCWWKISLQPNQKSTTEEVFSMVDHPTENFFTVNLSSLTVQDTDSYWCYVKRDVKGGYYTSYTTQYLLTITDLTTASPVSSYSGGRVRFRCDIPWTKVDLPKYLCRESDSGCTKLVRTERRDGWETSGRFSLEDGGGFLNVIIRELTKLDSAIYRCGVEERTGSDTSVTGFNLTVTEAGQRSVQQNGQVGGDFSFTCSYPDEHRDSLKVFCRDGSDTDCRRQIYLYSNQKSTTEGGFSMVDHPTENFLTVTLSRLTVQDTGSYWCCVEGGKYKSYTAQLNLTVTGGEW